MAKQAPTSVPYIPTGYENIPGYINRNRGVAEALMEAGLQGPGPNATHGAQLLGSLAQSLVGNLIDQKVQRKERDLFTATRQAETDGQAVVAAAMQEKKDPAEILAMFTGPQPAGVREMLVPFVEAYAQRLKNEQEGTREIFTGADGTRVDGIVDKTGRVSAPTDQFRTPEKISNVNNVAVALDAQPSGTVLPQPAMDSVIVGPDGKPAINPLALGARTQVASAGRPTTNINTQFQVDTLSNLAKYLPQAQVDSLTKSSATAEGYMAALPALERAEAALKSGVIVGSLSGIRLGTAKAADLLGIAGKSDQEKIVNTETFVREMGGQILPILQQLRPASDTDVKTARQMVGGDASLSLGAIQKAIASAKADGGRVIARHNQKVDGLANLYGRQAPDAALSIQSFRVFDNAPNGVPSGGSGNRRTYNPRTRKFE